MKLYIHIEIPLDSESICNAVKQAVEPDNVSSPRGILIAMFCSKNILVVDVKSSENIHILTFRNTIDDLLEHIGIALKSLRVVSRHGNNDLA